MPKVVVTNVENLGGNPNSAALAINENVQRVAAALENTLSRDGTNPNQMEADLDMNGYRVINVAAPVNPNDVVRLVDLTGDLSDIAGTVPSGGTAGQVLTKVSGTDYDYEWQDPNGGGYSPPIPQSDVTGLVGDLAALDAAVDGAQADATQALSDAADALAAAGAAVQPTRTITAGTGLSGGGDLSADRTIDLENTTVTPGAYTNADITVDAQGRITAAANGAGATVTEFYAIQGSDQTVVNNTLTNTDLSIALDAGTYIIECSGQFRSHTTPDLQMRFNYSGTVTSSRLTLRSGVSLAGLTRTLNSTNTEFTTTVDPTFAEWSGSAVLSTSGTLTLQFSQVTTSAGNPVAIYTGAWLRVTKVA